MKKTFRKYVSFVLAMCMVASLLPMTALATETVEVSSQKAAEEVASGTCGEDLTWVLDSDDTLTISGTGDMEELSFSSNAPWYDYKNDIITVVVEDGVTSLSSHSFYYCKNMTSAIIGNGMTKIAENTFADCSNLKTVTLSSSVTSLEKSAFSECARLNEVYYDGTIAQWNEIEVAESNIDITVFSTIYCSDGTIAPQDLAGTCGEDLTWSLVDGVLTIGGGTGEGMTYENSPWSEYKYRILEIVFEEGVTRIWAYAFSNVEGVSTNVISVTVPDSVTTIEADAFKNSDTLESVDLGNGV